jgi:predicted small lipoprotein YifL
MLKNTHRLIAKVAIALTSLMLLISCGTKGPLYIPEQRYPQKESSQTSMPPDEGIKANPEANTNAPPQPAQ